MAITVNIPRGTLKTTSKTAALTRRLTSDTAPLGREHRAPMAAFVVISFATCMLMVTAVRSEAVQDFISDRAHEIVIAGPAPIRDLVNRLDEPAPQPQADITLAGVPSSAQPTTHHARAAEPRTKPGKKKSPGPTNTTTANTTANTATNTAPVETPTPTQTAPVTSTPVVPTPTVSVQHPGNATGLPEHATAHPHRGTTPGTDKTRPHPSPNSHTPAHAGSNGPRNAPGHSTTRPGHGNGNGHGSRNVRGATPSTPAAAPQPGPQAPTEQAPGNSGTAPGNSGTAPGHTAEHPANGNGNSHP